MPLTATDLKSAFKRAAVYGIAAGALVAGSGCAVMNPEPASCMGAFGAIWVRSKHFDKDCGEYQIKKLKMESDIQRAADLFKDKNNPASQALASALYDEMGTEDQKKVLAKLEGQTFMQTAQKCIRSRNGNEITLHCPAKVESATIIPELKSVSPVPAPAQ